MKLVTFENGGESRIGVMLDADRILDIRLANERECGGAGLEFSTMLNLIEGGETLLERVRELMKAPVNEAVIAADHVNLKAPIPLPVQIRDCLVFEEHLKNSFARVGKMMGKELEIPPVWYQQPIYYKCNRMSVIGPGKEIIWPSYSNMMDFELELAIVIGKTGKDISAEEARGHIFGYTIFNDMTARDTQALEMTGQLGPAKGKDFDTGNVFGPCIVTRDEIKHPVCLDMSVSVNGEKWGGGNSSQMHYSFAQIISFISKAETLYAGEIIGSGTVGTGCGLEIGKFLQPGDEIELEIEKIGVLKNKIVKLN